MDTATLVGVIVGAIVTVVGVVTPAVISIIVALRTRDVVVAGAEANAENAKIADRKIDEVHKFVNSAATTMLRRLEQSARALAESTGNPAHIAEHLAVARELAEAISAQAKVEATYDALAARDAAAADRASGVVDTLVGKGPTT